MNTTMNTAAVTSVSANQKLISETFIANAARFGNVRAAYLPASCLIIDHDYQRQPSHRINQIAREFDDDKCGFLEVAYRADIGLFALIDGQNRFTAGKMAGRDRFACHIVTDISVKEEALKFASQDDNKTILNSYDKFKAELFAGVPESCQLKRICDDYGIRIKKSMPSQTGYLRSITDAKTALKVDGEAGLRWIFDIIKESGWHTVKNAYSSIMMRALHNIYSMARREDLAAIKENIIHIFEKTTPDYVIAQAMLAFHDCARFTALTRFLQKISAPIRDIEFIEQKN